MAAFLVAVKIVVTIATVLGLSVVAEHVSPRVAGVLSGYPLGAAIALFFFGRDIGPGFAAESAVYTIGGLTGTLCFVYGYYLTARRCDRWAIPMAPIGATAGYAVVIGMLQAIGLTKTAAVVLAVAVTIGFAFMFRHIEDAAIERPIRLTFGVMMLRAVLAAVTIVVITGAAKWIGTRWSGLLAAFPTTLFPLMLIVHFNYGSAAVNTIIKNFPRGLGSLILYALCVSVVYPRWGVYLGTFVSFAVATTYLAVYGTLVSKTGN